jgi:transposase
MFRALPHANAWRILGGACTQQVSGSPLHYRDDIRLPRLAAYLNLADEFSLQPSQIHTWVKQVLDQAEHALERPAGRLPRVEQLQVKLVERLQTKLVEKNEVIAKLMQEHVQLKKELGEP